MNQIMMDEVSKDGSSHQRWNNIVKDESHNEVWGGT